MSADNQAYDKYHIRLLNFSVSFDHRKYDYVYHSEKTKDVYKYETSCDSFWNLRREDTFCNDIILICIATLLDLSMDSSIIHFHVFRSHRMFFDENGSPPFLDFTTSTNIREFHCKIDFLFSSTRVKSEIRVSCLWRRHVSVFALSVNFFLEALWRRDHNSLPCLVIEIEVSIHL